MGNPAAGLGPGAGRPGGHRARKGLRRAGGRDLYRRFGLDPTRCRPSGEALLRRLRQGEPLPRIGSLVDVADVVWLRFQVLVGLYDLVRGRGRLRLRPDLRGRRPRPLRQPFSRPGTVIATDTRRAAWIFFLPVSEPALALTCEPVPGYGCGGVRRP